MMPMMMLNRLDPLIAIAATGAPLTSDDLAAFAILNLLSGVYWVLEVIFWIVIFFVFVTYWMTRAAKRMRLTHPDNPERRGNAEPPLSVWQWAYAMVGEVFTTYYCVLMSATIPFSRRATYARVNPNGRPVLLVHGYNHNETGFGPLRRRLARAGYGPVYSLNLRPIFGDIREISKLLIHKVERIREKNNGAKVILIGHSMGGLVSATYTELLGGAESVEQVITLGSPIRGTTLAGMGAGLNGLQMQPNSDLVAVLDEKIGSSDVPYYHIGTQLDNMIFPYEYAFLDESAENNLVFDHIGHVALIFSGRVCQAIIDRLNLTAPASN